MQKEISAGGVIVKKSQDTWDLLVLKDMKGNWTFPKGLIDEGEEEEEAARREIFEEVGLRFLTRIGKLRPIHYKYQRNGPASSGRGELIDKTVIYFLFEFVGKEKLVPQKEEGINEIRWVPLDAAKKIVGYPKTNGPLLKEAITYLKSKNQ